MKISLSAKSFNALQRDPDGAKVQRIWFQEFRGLGVDLGKLKKSIIYKYKAPSGKFRIISIDSFSYSQLIDDDLIDGVISDCYRLKDKIRMGVDPLNEKDETRQQRKQEQEAIKQKAKEQAYTLNQAFNNYTKHRLYTQQIASSTQAVYLGVYNRHIAPKFGKTPISELEPVQINIFLETLADSTCNAVIAVLRRIQKVAVLTGKLRTPFIFDTDRRTIGKRTRTIADLPYFLEWLTDTRLNQSYKNALHTQLLYGCRAGEIFGMKWDEVDEKNGLINIPWQRVKNRRVALKQFHPLTIPILPALQNILDQQKVFGSKFVFPQIISNQKPTNNQCVYELLKRSGFKLSSHDIRRTVATLLRNELRATVDDIDSILDHSLGTVNQSYIHGTPLEIKRRILSRWHTYLQSQTNPEITTIKAVSGK